MDDRPAQFFSSVADLCLAATLAQLEIEVTTRDGVCVRGVPGRMQRADGERELDDSGFARIVQLGGYTVDLETLIACTLHFPTPLPADELSHAQ